MPPLWALGFQLCKYGYNSLDNLKEVVDRMLATDMPYVSNFNVTFNIIDFFNACSIIKKAIKIKFVCVCLSTAVLYTFNFYVLSINLCINAYIIIHVV